MISADLLKEGLPLVEGTGDYEGKPKVLSESIVNQKRASGDL